MMPFTCPASYATQTLSMRHLSSVCLDPCGNLRPSDVHTDCGRRSVLRIAISLFAVLAQLSALDIANRPRYGERPGLAALDLQFGQTGFASAACAGRLVQQFPVDDHLGPRHRQAC